MFEAIARGEIKALWVMATNPAVSLPHADAVREALKKLELFVVSENVRRQRHGQCRRTCAAAGAGLGREIRHRDQFRTPHLAAARVPRRARRGQARLVDRQRGRADGSALPRRSTSARRRISSASTPRCRRSRTTVPAISTSARWRRCRTSDFDAMAPVQWPLRAAATRAAGALLRRGRLLRQRPQGALHRAGNSGAAHRDHAGTAAAAQHRPHPRPVAHHDPHRREPAARPASAGAVRRGSPRRRRAVRPRRRRLRAGHHRLRPMHAQGRRQRAPAARHAVRADPLERRERDRRPRRRAGGAVDRSVLRPAREQGDAGVDHALRIRVPRLCAVAQAARICRTMPGGRASPSPAVTAICSPTMPIWQAGSPGCDPSLATISPNTRILAAASIARRRLPATASRPACSSGPRTTPATGTWSRSCSRPTRSSGEQRRMLLSGKSVDGLANAGPIVCACFGVGRNTICDAIAAGARSAADIGAQAEGRHQLRLLHSGAEAADRADRRRAIPSSGKLAGGELASSPVIASAATQPSVHAAILRDGLPRRCRSSQ